MNKIDWKIVMSTMVALVIWYYVSPMLTTSTTTTTTPDTDTGTGTGA